MGRSGRSSIIVIIFIFRSFHALFLAWLGPKRRRLDSSEGKPSIIIIIIIFTFLGPGQREEDWTGRGRTGKPSIIVINIIIFTFHAFLDSGQREEEVDKSDRIDDAIILVARILESAKYHRLESLC